MFGPFYQADQNMKKIIYPLAFTLIVLALFLNFLYAQEAIIVPENNTLVNVTQEESIKPVEDRKQFTSFRVTKRIRVKCLADLQTLQIRFPLIRKDFRGQTIKQVTLSPEYNALLHDPDKNDIAMYYFPSVKAGEDIVLVMEYKIDIEDSDFFVSPAEAGEAGDSVELDLGRYLKSDADIDIDNVFIRETAQQITKGIKNPFAKGKALYNYIANDIKYENTDEVSGFQSPEDTLRIKRGNCADMARLFITLARISGIPARQVNGMVFSPDVSRNKSKRKYEHAWAEIYFPKYGWLPVDPTTGVTSREDYYCFNYKIHIRESYGPVIQRSRSSLYKGMYMEGRSAGAGGGRLPVQQDFEVEVDLLNW